MQDPTLKQIQKLRDTAERKIGKIVRDFEIESDVYVNKISLNHRDPEETALEPVSALFDIDYETSACLGGNDGR